MHRRLCLVSFSLALLTLTGNAQAGFVDEEDVAGASPALEATSAAAAQAGPTLDDFLTVVKNTLNKVKLDKDQPPLKKVTVNLKTTTGGTRGVNFKIFVISFGTTTTDSSEQTLNIDLAGELGKEAAVTEAAGQTPPPVSSRLAATIEAAHASLKAAGFSKSSEPLKTGGVSLTQKFIVKKTGSVGANLSWTIVPISIGLSGGRDRGYENQIVFEFANPQPKETYPGGHPQ